MIESIIPENKEHWLQLRMQDITSTDVSALFGLSPYCTKFELWHRKKRGEIVDFKENKRMKWGTKLQDTIAETIAEEQGWKVRRMDEYMRDTKLRAGASFDFSIEEIVEKDLVKWQLDSIADGRDINDFINTLGLLEIKNVDGLVYRDKWTDDEAPNHIEMQVQHQLMVSCREFAYIGALIGGNDEKLIRRERDEVVIKAMRQAIKDFWISIDNNEPPSPDFKADAEFIAKLYGYAEPNKLFDARGNAAVLDLAQEYKRLGEEVKQRTTAKDAIKAQLLIIIGDAEKVTGDGFSISAGIVSENDISYHRNAYRMFKPSWKKKK